MPSANKLPISQPEPQRTESGWDARRRRISAHLEKVALTLFAERGYEAVTVAEIAAAADVSPRTVARYYAFKEDFILSLPRQAGADALQRFRDVGVPSDPVAAVWDMWLELARSHSGDLDRMLLWDRAVKTAPELRALATGEIGLQLNAALTQLCGRALGCDPKKDVRASVLAAMLAAANDAVVSFWLNSGGRADIFQLLTRAREVLPHELRALSAKS